MRRGFGAGEPVTNARAAWHASSRSRRATHERGSKEHRLRERLYPAFSGGDLSYILEHFAPSSVLGVMSNFVDELAAAIPLT